MNGIIIIDKPQEWTSNDVVSRLRRVFNTRRIGHGGTLDPMATGVLPVFVGRATRGVEFFEHAEKTYETVLKPGITTDTEDMTGTILTQQEVSLTEEQVLAVLPRFRGEILQVPPMYSALKVNGQKLYDLARKGREVERQPRPITIHELTYLGMDDEGIRLRHLHGRRPQTGHTLPLRPIRELPGRRSCSRFRSPAAGRQCTRPQWIGRRKTGCPDHPR